MQQTNTKRYLHILIIVNVLLLALAALLLGGHWVRAGGTAQTAPHLISYQGLLADSNGNLIDGARDLMVKVFDVETGGTALWQETHTAVDFDAGAFAITLGSNTPLPETLFDTPDRWLEMSVDGTTLSPRQQFTSAPYAINADKVDGMDAADLGGMPAGAVTWFEYGSNPAGFAPLDAPGRDIGRTRALPQMPDTGGSLYCPVWTGSQVICWNSSYDDPSGGAIYTPASNEWITMSVANAPAPRSNPYTVWTGSEMILWGGTGSAFGDYLNTGGRYNPETDTWTPMTTVNAPAGRSNYFGYSDHQNNAAWTGSRMFVWGGLIASDTVTNTGALYDPVNDQWTAVSTVNAPSARWNHKVVWTGSEIFVWGGLAGSLGDAALKSGGLYDPDTDSWSSVSTINAPRGAQEVVWTGTEVAVVADMGLYFYNPATDTWRQTDALLGGGSFGLALVNDWLVGVNQIYDLSQDKEIAASVNYPAYALRPGFWTGTELLSLNMTGAHELQIIMPYVKE